MNSLADLVFSPASNKLEEPCESWWMDWYPSGHATPESLLHSKAANKDPLAMETAPQDACNRSNKDFWAANSLECFKTEDQRHLQTEAVPCIAQDLELEIAELEQQAWSDSALSDLGVFDDDISFADDGATSFANCSILRMDAVQSWGLSTSRKLPCLAVDVKHRCKEEVLDSCKESSHGSARDGDSTPSSGDDASTHSSFARNSPKYSSTSAHYPTASLPEPTIPTAAGPAPRSHPAAPCPRKLTARQTTASRASAPSNSGQHSSCSSDHTAPLSDPSDVSSSHQHRHAAAPARTASAALPPPIPQHRPLKRTSSTASTTDAATLSPPAKVARIERPRREGSGMNSLILARCGADIASLSAPSSPAKPSDAHRGKRTVDASTRSPVKSKAKGKAAGSPRGGKKRVPAKCAPPAPGVHACSQCGAQSTPVWRAGPFGPKTLCNACGVRYMKIAKRK